MSICHATYLPSNVQTPGPGSSTRAVREIKGNRLLRGHRDVVEILVVSIGADADEAEVDRLALIGADVDRDLSPAGGAVVATAGGAGVAPGRAIRGPLRLHRVAVGGVARVVVHPELQRDGRIGAGTREAGAAIDRGLAARR